MSEDPQHQAIKSDAKQLIVIACAGSGKTSTLIKRVASKISKGEASASSVTIITFTIKAAEEIRLRLSEVIADKQALSDVYVGTIHGFCRFALTTFLPRTFETLEVLSSVQQLALLSAKRKEWGLAEIKPTLFESSKGEFFRSLAATFDLIKQENVDPSKLRESNPHLAEAFSKYNDYLRENNLADFTDLVRLTLHFLETSQEFRKAIRNRAHWLFVDEYQDVDPLQHRLILSLSEEGHLCVIGDDDQAIYQFRGTDFKHFISLTQPAPNREVITLGTNFRCRANILQNGKQIIEQISERTQKTMSASKPGGIVFKKRFTNVSEEAQFIVDEIKKLRDQEAIKKYADVAILLRSVASHGPVYIRALRQNNVPFRTRGDGTLFEEPTAILLTRVLEFIAQETTDIQHLEILGPPYQITSSAKDWTDLTDRDWELGGLNTSPISLMRKWDAARARYMGRKFTSLLEIVLEVIASFDILGTSQEPLTMANVGLVTQLVQDFDQIAQTKNLFFLCGFLAMHAEGIADQVFTPGTQDAVNILTVHQAKGLQFSSVFIPMLCEGRFPSEKDDSRHLLDPSLYEFARYQSNINEERRLFYVAVTRAADRLYATSPIHVGLVRPKLASIFFTELTEAESTETAISVHSIDHTDLPLSTSYSSLELYLSCPYRYKLAKIYSLTTPPNPFFEFGRVLHQVLRQVHELTLQGLTVSEADVEQMYDKSFKLRLYVPQVTIAMRRAAGLKAIKTYLRKKQDWMARTYAVEKEFNYVFHKSLLSGRYDLILKNGEYEIIDFKTGRPHEYINTDFQLGLYSLVAKEYFNLPIKRAVICYVEHEIETEYIINADLLADVKSKYGATVSAIKREHFVATPGEVCVRCEYRKMCPYKQ